MTARPIMIQGTMSGAGKSLLCAGLCRVLSQRGLRVAPFKSQNMALNSGVTADGLEMGRAQVVQAQAAGVEPDVRMNPILLKPTSDIGSQVIVLGEVWRTLSAQDYYAVKSSLIPTVREAYESLAAENDVIVIEGAGSPAEINLPGDGFVNMGLARLVSAPVLLVGDIDRGGVFAQLYGTVALLSPEDRARVRGLVINKFRGDESILRPGLRQLEELCGAPVAGVVPYTVLDIDDEDSLAPRLRTGTVAADEDALTVAVIRLPRISNFTDFAPLEAHPDCAVVYTVDPEEVARVDVVIIPGTKSTLDDLRWLRETGLAEAIVRRAREGATVIGLCGGYQMLGQCLEDPEGVEGAAGESARGLGLLPVRTRFESGKTRTRVQGVVVAPPWQGAALEGYEIHMGRTTVEGEPFCLIDRRPEGSAQGTVFGTYLHGLFDSGELVEALLADHAQRKGTRYQVRPVTSRHAQLEESFDRLADTLRRSLDWKLIDGLLEINDE